MAESSHGQRAGTACLHKPFTSRAAKLDRGISRRGFLKKYGILSSALTLSPYFIERWSALAQSSGGATMVYKVKNGPDCFQNISKLLQLLGGISAFISPTDVVVIKANAQWPNQGYTHTGCIKAVIDSILAIPGFSGEVLLCDCIQGGGWGPGNYGFDVAAGNRVNNWPDKNWTELGNDYRAQGKPVATVQWRNDPTWRSPSGALPSWSTWNPANGTGWSRYFFNYKGRNTYLSYPVFASPITPGRIIDIKNGIWENGLYTGRRDKAIFMPTLNNHSYDGGGEDYAGITSAIKSFFGASEIFHGSPTYISDDYVWNGFYNLHSDSYTYYDALTAGNMVGKFINTLYSPVLYITSAMYSGWFNRTATNGAAFTNTVLACTNPASLDYISCRDVISPYASWLNPDQNNNTRKQIIGCINQGVGTIDPLQLQLVTYDFQNPSISRLDIDRKVRDFEAGLTTEQDVKNTISQYMHGP